MDKNDNGQVASPATAESPSSNVESNQQRNDSTGDDGLFLAEGYFLFYILQMYYYYCFCV
jgi:hypothetical protein